MKGPSPNAYGGDGSLILGITWTETTLATIAVLLRIFSASKLVKRADWDLFWVSIAWSSAFVAQIFLTISVTYGSGNHIVNLTKNDIVQSQRWGWFAQLVAIFAIGFGKIAVIALLLRIQGLTHKKKRWLLHFIWITNTILNISQTVLILYACTPLEKLWNDYLPGSCAFRSTTSKAGFFQGSWAAASDAVLASYPIFVFWDLNMSTRRKVGLCALMGGGYIAAVAGTMKTIYIKLITVGVDYTYSITPLLIWALTEMWLIIFLGSIPQLRVVFVLLKEKVEGASRHTSVKEDPFKGEMRQAEEFVESTTVDGSDTSAQRTVSETCNLPPLTQILVTNCYTVTYEQEDVKEFPSDVQVSHQENVADHND